MTTRRRIPWWVWQIGSLIAFAVAALGVIGEHRGWWNLLGEMLTWGGLVVGLVLGYNSATERTVRALDDRLASIDDRLATINVVLERIAVRFNA